jgi:mannose-1-phosphate guanylyltransferase
MCASDSHHLWTVVLAGGEGTRLRRLTRALHGEDRPKQFAFIHGGQSLLQTTLARAERWSAPEHSVVVVAREREALARTQISAGSPIDVVAQPYNRGTGPGLLLPLSRILARDPDALVVILPSDHYVRDEAPFERSILNAIATARAEDSVVLVGALPDSAETQYGWIMGSGGVQQKHGLIRQFWEKPALDCARRLFSGGALWNTFVMVGSARRFWQLACAHLPVQARCFDAYRQAVDTPDERRVLDEIYATLPSADFSADVLQRARDLRMVPLEACGWSDWGTPERVLESLRRDFRSLTRQLEAAEQVTALERLQVAALSC